MFRATPEPLATMRCRHNIVTGCRLGCRLYSPTLGVTPSTTFPQMVISKMCLSVKRRDRVSEAHRITISGTLFRALFPTTFLGQLAESGSRFAEVGPRIRSFTPAALLL